MKLPYCSRANRRIRGPLAVAAVLLAAAPAAWGQGWWNSSWPYRRAVTLADYKPTRLGGSDVAVVTMPTGGKHRRDGSDVRVATASRTEVASRVLMVGPGDQVRVAFAPRGSGRRYYVYFGHAKPPGQPKPLEIRRGVLLETWQYPGGGIKTLQQVRAVFARAKRLIGRDFRDRMFLGHNPFGPQSSIASRFTAYLNCEISGQYTFACSSQDASFLLVDDNVVVSNGGHHSPQRDIRMKGATALKKGLHKLTFYHVNTTGHPIAVAAWQPPGAKRVWPIARERFAPVFVAQVGPMEQYGRSMGIDFLPRHGGETFLRNRYYQRWTFEAMPVGRLGRSANLAWDFGDGQTAAAPKVEHVYLLPGERTVTLTATVGGRTVSRSHKIFVSRPWDLVATNRLDGVSQQAQIVQGYDFAALSAEANAHAILLLERAKSVHAMTKAGLALVARKAAPAPLVALVVPLFAEQLPPRQRVEAFLKAEKTVTNAAVAASMAQQAARACLHGLGDADAAGKLFARVIRQYGATTSHQAIRQAKIGLGDVGRLRGKLKEARKAYRAAGLGAKVNPARLEIIKGDYARHVEDYLVKGDFSSAIQYVERWESDIPLDKLEGYWSLLVVRLNLKRKKHADAAREALTLVNVNPASNYAPRLLLLAAEACRKTGKAAESRSALRRIIEKYPESPLVAAARAALNR